jgi:hypothetical protein
VNDLLALLQEFHREKLSMMLRHQAGARLVRQYDINNTYQYIINREDVQLSWLASAIADLGGAVESGLAEPELRAASKDAWRGMLRVILGETLEQKRFFEQAAAGNLDLLGRRPDHVGPRVGEVLPTRWVE